MKIIDDNDKLITIANETKSFFLSFITRMQPVLSLGTSGCSPIIRFIFFMNPNVPNFKSKRHKFMIIIIVIGL